MSCTDASRHCAASVMPKCFCTDSAMRSAWGISRKVRPNGALWITQRRKCWRTWGMASMAKMDRPPADWPATVMLSGSPPKAAISRATHSSAAHWSISPKLGGLTPGRCMKPRAPKRWFTPTTTMSLCCAIGTPLYQSKEPAPVQNAPPCNHSKTGRRAPSAAGVAMVRVRQSSPWGSSKSPMAARKREAGWGGMGPLRLASRTPLQGAMGCGVAKRKAPTGAWA